MFSAKVRKEIEMIAKWLVGIGFLGVVVVGLMAYFGNAITPDVFAKVGVVAVGAAFILAFYGLVLIRTATVFAVTTAILLVSVLWLHLPAAKKANYQAVFLTNGQVYFGHLKNVNSNSPVLSDIYYLQSSPSNPQGTSEQNNQQSTSSSSLTLVKLGQELHGPEDQMALKSDQILFWENLKDNSKVVQAIKQNQSK